jgi:hypothetical protein
MAGNGSFASKSVTRHVVRGVLGFGAIIAAFALIPVFGWPSLVLVPLGMLALRGCPVCWILGLIETVSRGRLQRECVDGSCQLRST